MTECNQSQFEFEAHFSRRVVAEFSGERLTTEGGALLLRAADRKMGLLRRVVRCFRDARDPQRIEHELSEMLAQRIYGLALGYEDLNDHEQLRNDPLLGVLAGKKDLGEPLAGKSTLNRLELTPVGFTLRGTLQQDQLLSRSARRTAGRPFSGSAPASAARDRAGPGRHRHAAARTAGSAFFSRLLRTLLLSAVVRVLRGSSAVRAAAALEHRRQRRESRRSTAHRAADSRAVAGDPHHPASGLRLLPRRTAGVVRKQRGGLCIWLCAQPTLAEDHRPRHAASQTRAPANGKSGAGVLRVRLSHQEKLVAGAAGDRQSGTDRRQGKSPLPGHVAGPRGLARAETL